MVKRKLKLQSVISNRDASRLHLLSVVRSTLECGMLIRVKQRK